ncbi:MAG: 1-deoxy-D-xylulose-5-phosphate reductoisomerase [Erysipelotrichia bacterium]|nr:1-deoxy-D-xylulose-5-phosphate reductoisomerase [Erysipelotrichia bacterium]
MSRRIVLLGASGSIGSQTLDVISQHPSMFSLTAVGVGRNMEALRKILSQFSVDMVSVESEEDAAVLRKEYPSVKILSGDEGMCTLAARSDYDVLVNALVGFAGFAPTMSAIKAHHDIALANKETLVVGGVLIKKALQEYGVSLYPIDSEHSAIFQCLQGNRKEQVERLLITCSGGAFRDKTREELAEVTPEMALAHPNWTMGPKITIDCADLMNKGFEVTEAHWLFDIPYDRIQVVMHRESVVHSMVEYQDHSIIAQLGAPDMRLPIQYALTWPERLPLHEDHPLDLLEVQTLHFDKPDLIRFPLLQLAYEAGEKGGNLDAVMNAANEAVNLAFRNHEISFLAIESIVSAAVHEVPFKEIRNAEDLYEADAWGRAFALDRIAQIREKR